MFSHRAEKRRREKGRSALFRFSITGALSNRGGRGKLQKYRNTRIQKYLNGEILELKEENAENRKREGLQCAGFPLLEAFPIRGRGVYCCLSRIEIDLNRI